MAPTSNIGRPLTARSVIASTLLGLRPPRLDAATLVRSGALFGIAEGTTRVALSRMVATGEVEPDGDNRYRLTGDLLRRQARQEASRRGATEAWDGRWRLAVVTADRRPAPARVWLRSTMRDQRMSEWREGVWLRPHNLPAAEPASGGSALGDQGQWLTSTLDGSRPGDRSVDAILAGSLWDLNGWASRARDLMAAMAGRWPDLDAGRADVLGPAFVLAADVLRHLQADPLLPPELVPGGWPGPALRDAYQSYDAAFTAVWRDWYRAQREGGEPQPTG